MMPEQFLLIIPLWFFGISWGSFLHATAFRIAFDKNLLRSRSHCPSCDALIAWYDNIPVVSWLVLKARCRACKKGISCAYPLAEISVGFLVVALFFKIFSFDFFKLVAVYRFHPSIKAILLNQLMFFFIYLLLVSNLIIATITDLYVMAIPQVVTLWMVPIGFVCSYFQLLPISFFESVFGVLVGYGFLWSVALLFKLLRKKDGMGVGDMELMAMVGSFLGAQGAFATIMLASLSGSLIGCLILAMGKKKLGIKIPFAPFLSLGALLYIFFQEWIHWFFFHIS